MGSVDMGDNTEFQVIFTSFCNGLAWLERKKASGEPWENDRRDFEVLVAQPLDAMWATMSSEEKTKWLWVLSVVQKFGAEILPDA